MEVNSDYFSDKPQAFGGKYGLYNIFEKKKVDSALENNDIYTRFINISVPRSSPLFMFIKKGNFFNLM